VNADRERAEYDGAVAQRLAELLIAHWRRKDKSPDAERRDKSTGAARRDSCTEKEKSNRRSASEFTDRTEETPVTVEVTGAGS
jgi:hypothetical protein